MYTSVSVLTSPVVDGPIAGGCEQDNASPPSSIQLPTWPTDMDMDVMDSRKTDEDWGLSGAAPHKGRAYDGDFSCDQDYFQGNRHKSKQ